MNTTMKKEQVFNYIGSLVFISVILLFLFSLVFISRFALNDTGGLQEYVVSTKTLLEDIDEVQKEVRNETSPTRIDLKNFHVFDESYGVEDISYLNNKDKESFFTLRFNSTIKETEKYYILEIDEDYEFIKGQRILFLENEGIVLENEENTIEVYNIETTRITTIKKEEIGGVIIYEKN